MRHSIFTAIDFIASAYALVKNTTPDARIEASLYENVIQSGEKFFSNLPFVNLDEYIMFYKEEDDLDQLRKTIGEATDFLYEMEKETYDYFRDFNSDLKNFEDAMGDLYDVIYYDILAKEWEEEA